MAFYRYFFKFLVHFQIEIAAAINSQKYVYLQSFKFFKTIRYRWILVVVVTVARTDPELN